MVFALLQIAGVDPRKRLRDKRGMAYNLLRNKTRNPPLSLCPRLGSDRTSPGLWLGLNLPRAPPRMGLLCPWHLTANHRFQVRSQLIPGKTFEILAESREATAKLFDGQFVNSVFNLIVRHTPFQAACVAVSFRVNASIARPSS